MRYRRVDNIGDYTLGAKENYVKDKDATVLAVQSKLTLLQGEWWENLEDGTPYFQHILGLSGSDASKQSVDLLVQDRILAVGQVTSIEEFVSTIEDRTYRLTCILNTIYGQAELEVML
jgi:hypothetical protein